MLKVAIDAGPLHGPRTGVGNAVAWSIDALERLDANSGLTLLPYVTSTRAELHPTEKWPVRRLPLPAALALRLWARSDQPTLDRPLGRPDLVHGTNYVVPPTRCPRLISVYDCWFLDHPDDAEPDVRRAAAVLRRAVAKGADVVCSSQATADRATELLDTDRVHIIHLGPPDDQPAADSTSQMRRLPANLTAHRYVLALGTLERRKNLTTLIAAFGRLADELEDVQLVIAGRDGNDSANIADAIGALSSRVRHRIIRLGPVDDAVKHVLLEHAGVLAYPSLDEGFGFPILEAQRAQTPVVASTAGSIPEIAGSAALLSRPDDPTALAANLYSAVTSADIRQHMITRGLANVDRFSWQANAEAHLALYTRLVERSS